MIKRSLEKERQSTKTMNERRKIRQRSEERTEEETGEI